MTRWRQCDYPSRPSKFRGKGINLYLMKSSRFSIVLAASVAALQRTADAGAQASGGGKTITEADPININAASASFVI